MKRPRFQALLCRLGVGLQRRTGADEVAVAEDIVDAVDRRPVFVDAEGARRVAGLFARIGAVPVADEIFHRMRRILQRIVHPVHPAIIDRLNAEVVKILAMPEVKKQMADQGAEPNPEKPAQLAAFMKSETAKWAKVVKASGATVD